MMKNLNELSQILMSQRKALGFEQKDMYMRIGMKQQQYQRIETGNDVKLSTLLRILEGLDLELSIQPKAAKQSTRILSESELPEDLRDDDEADDLAFWFGTEVNDG